jgi:hypothetical protein
VNAIGPFRPLEFFVLGWQAFRSWESKVRLSIL